MRNDFDDVHRSKSDPNSLFPSHRIYTLHNEKQTDERTTRDDKKCMEFDHDDQYSFNSII